MNCEPGRVRAHARLTYILTGALHRFIETSAHNNKGKGKASISRDGFGIDSIVEDAERLLLRAQAMAAYALRLDDNGNLIDGGPRTGVSPSVAGVEGPEPHTTRPTPRIGTHKEFLATFSSFKPSSRAPPSPPPMTEEILIPSPLSQPFQDSSPEACVWPARLPATPTSVQVIRRKPTPSGIVSTTATGDAVRPTSPPFRHPPNPSGVKARKAVPLPFGLPPTLPTPEAVQRPHSTPWLRGVDEETVVDPLTGLPAQRATGFEPGPSNREPGPIKPTPYQNLPTRPQPIAHTQLINTRSSDWWATEELPVPPSNSSFVEPQDGSRASGRSASNLAYPLFLSSTTPGVGCSPPPCYTEFEPNNAMEEDNTPSIKEGEQTKKGSLKHFFKMMRRGSQRIQTGADGAIAQRLQDEEDQVFFTMNLNNQFDDPIENPTGNISTMSDRLLAQHLQETEELAPQEPSTQALRSPSSRRGSLRQVLAAEDPQKWTALQEDGKHSVVRGTPTEQQKNEWEEDYRSITNLEAVRESIEQTSVLVGHTETRPKRKFVTFATLPEKQDCMEADLKAAHTLQTELDEEARQQDIRTLRELQAEIEEEEYQDARLAAKLAAEWEKEDRQEMERIWEQESTCIMCVERYEESELFKPCSDKQHIWCRRCLNTGFRTALKTRSRLRCCRNIGTKSLPSLDPAFVKQYNLMLLEMDTANPMYCSVKACGAFIPPRSFKGDLGTCTKCKKRSCVHCKAREHPGQICAEDEDTQRVLLLAKKKKWKQCPGCRNMIEKTEGCLHMTCSRCRGEFCYHCGQLWSKCKNLCSRGDS